MSVERVKRAKADLEAALGTLSELKVRTVQFGSDPQPPSVTIGPPRVIWDGYSPEPVEAEFTVFLISAFDGRVVERLIELIEPTVLALESVTNATVGDVVPTTYIPAGLPCYAVPVNIALS